MLAQAAAIGFVRIFAATPEGPRVAHAPALRTGPRAFRFHLANKNALTPHLAGSTALLVAEGPNGYVSANWYADVRAAVPTWNYVAIEVEGPVRAIGRPELIAMVDDLATTLEPRVGENWTRAKMEPHRFNAMLGAISGFELMVAAVRGTAKLSQNQPDIEADRVASGMERNGATAMAAAIRAART